MDGVVNPGGRYRSLDLWRGAACLAVVVYHAAGAATLSSGSSGFFDRLALPALRVVGFGWIGVPVFFVISGYCIAATSDSQRHRGLPTRRFFERRFWRIYPPYWAFLGLMAVVI